MRKIGRKSRGSVGVVERAETAPRPKKTEEKLYKFWTPHIGYKQTLEPGGTYEEGGVQMVTSPVVAEFELHGKNGAMWTSRDPEEVKAMRKKIAAKRELIKAVREVTDDPTFAKVRDMGSVSKPE